MAHNLSKVLRVYRVQDVHEVLAGWALVLGVFVREVLHELLVLLELGPNILDREFLIEGNLDCDYLVFAEELFLTGEYLLEKVLVYRGSRWQVILDCREVRSGSVDYLRCLSR